MNQKDQAKLEGYVRYYLRKVLGEDYILKDGPQPGILLNKKPRIIQLPLSTTTLSLFLGPEFVENAPLELLLSIQIGLLYHEAAHDKSGEEFKTEPKLLNNLICDANDISVCPNLWPGSIPFSLSLLQTSFEMSLDAEEAKSAGLLSDRLKILLSLAVTYMRRLRVMHNGQPVRSLPKGEDHLFAVFEDRIKPLMREARKCPVADRPKLVQALYAALKEFWREEVESASGGNGKNGETNGLQVDVPEMEDALNLPGNDPMMIGSGQLTGKEAKHMASDSAMQEVMSKAGDLMRQAEEDQKREEESQKGRGGGISSKAMVPFDLKEMESQDSEPVEVDQALAASVRAAIQPLLFERMLKRRGPSLVGSKFNPSRFYEIKTSEKPRIKKDTLRIGRGIDEALVVLCMDRSGSMSDNGKEAVAKQVAGTMFYALSLIPRVRVIVLGFNQAPTLIKPSSPRLVPTILRRIRKGLSADGGTHFPVALQEAVRLAKEAKAHRRLVVMLTDGDLGGSPPPSETLQAAKQENIEVICIGVQGSSLRELQQVFGKNAIYVPDVRKLPEEVRKVVVERTTGVV